MRTIPPTQISVVSHFFLISALVVAAIVAFAGIGQPFGSASVHSFASFVIPAEAEMAKHIPSNAVTPAYTPAMAASDLMLAAIFGGPGAVAAAHGFEPVGLASQYPLYRGDLISDDGRMLRGHLSYAMHLYGSANGTGNTDLYVPLGFISHSNAPTPTDAAVTFYYPRLGNLTDVTLAVFHVANFKLSSEGGRVRIGNIGGPGGSIACYKHSHIEFYRGDTGLPPSASRPGLRIDPATVFETTADTASRSRMEPSARSSYTFARYWASLLGLDGHLHNSTSVHIASA